jgi:hypothetical protein
MANLITNTLDSIRGVGGKEKLLRKSPDDSASSSLSRQLSR